MNYKANPSSISDLFPKKAAKELPKLWFNNLWSFYLKSKGFRKIIFNEAISKGKYLEPKGLNFLQSHCIIFEATNLQKNEELKEDFFLRGTADFVNEKFGIDLKISQDVFTFSAAEKSQEYDLQCKSYCFLYQVPKYYLCYVLLPDTDRQIQRQLKRVDYYYEGDDVEETKEQIIQNNELILNLDPEDRIKVFEIKRDKNFEIEMRKRVFISKKIVQNFKGIDENQNFEIADKVFSKYVQYLNFKIQ